MYLYWRGSELLNNLRDSRNLYALQVQCQYTTYYIVNVICSIFFFKEQVQAFIDLLSAKLPCESGGSFVFSQV